MFISFLLIFILLVFLFPNNKKNWTEADTDLLDSCSLYKLFLTAEQSRALFFFLLSHTFQAHKLAPTCVVQTACRCITRLRVPSPVLLFPSLAPLLSVTLSRSTSSHPPSVGLTTYWKMRKIISSFSCSFLFHPSQPARPSCSRLCSSFNVFCPLIFLSLPSPRLLALISLF